MIRNQSYRKAFTLVEILVVVCILTAVSSVVIFSFFSFSKQQSLNSGALNVMSVLNEARSLAMSSKDFSNYGVHINQNSIILFENYLGTNNKEYDMGDSVSIDSDIVGDEILFNKVTGGTSDNGTVTVSLTSDPTQSKVITIYGTGATEMN